MITIYCGRILMDAWIELPDRIRGTPRMSRRILMDAWIEFADGRNTQ